MTEPPASEGQLIAEQQSNDQQGPQPDEAQSQIQNSNNKNNINAQPRRSQQKKKHLKTNYIDKVKYTINISRRLIMR